MDPIFCIALIMGGFLMICIEFLIPGGVLGAIGVCVVIAGVIASFGHSVVFGMWMLPSTVLTGAIVAVAFFKFFPISPMGKHAILHSTGKEWTGYDTGSSDLLGQEGIAQTPLHPTGIARISNKRVDVVTRGELIDANEQIRVLEVHGNRVVVSKVKAPEKTAETETTDQDTTSKEI